MLDFLLKSSQLTILAAAAIIAAWFDGFFVLLLLAAHAQAHTTNGFTTGRGNDVVTFLAICQAFSAWQLIAGMFDCVLDGCINLLLYGTVFRKTTSHLAPPDLAISVPTSVIKKSTKRKDLPTPETGEALAKLAARSSGFSTAPNWLAAERH